MTKHQLLDFILGQKYWVESNWNYRLLLKLKASINMKSVIEQWEKLHWCPVGVGTVVIIITYSDL